MTSKIVVVGSLNMDMVISVNKRPDAGETVLANHFFMNPGGKGANQALAARKLGATVSMIGKVGDDLFADQLLSSLDEVGVDCSGIDKVENQATGVAVITLDQRGNNSIAVSPGANTLLAPVDVRRQEELIKKSKMLMVQLEIPLETVIEALTIAKRHNIPVLLDPSPAQHLSVELLSLVDYIVPNELEIAQITGKDVFDQVTAKVAAHALLKNGVSTVLAKLGEKGVLVVNSTQSFFIEPYKVNAVDTTGAGDAFAGALGAALVSDKDIKEATKFASAVGAITVTREGAQASIPNLDEAELFIKQRKCQENL